MKFFFFFLLLLFIVPLTSKASFYQHGTVTIDIAHPRKIPDLMMAFGGGVDGHSEGEEATILSPQNVQAMKTSGLQPLSYRLRTELGIEAWHWNPHGSWSDEEHHQGYWASSTTTSAPIITSYGYRLPRRGNTLDEANNEGYSRLDDGNPTTFWKSNPYLTPHYTREPEEAHPQWVIVDFEKKQKINAIRLHWKKPYACTFRVQYATGGSIYLGHNAAWHDFPHGKITHGEGGDPFLYLGRPSLLGWPLSVRFVRILMTKSSGTAPEGSLDARDGMGFALGEIEIGEQAHDGHFQDRIIHRPDTHQTLIYVSSTDPWHRACDRDAKTEQPGIDFIRTCGLTHHLRTLWAIPILYDTPENAAAAATYIARHSPTTKTQAPWFELGEEPDGQRVDPKDVAALYAQVAAKIHTTSPGALLGGLSFVTVDVEPGDTTYRYDHRWWLHRFFKQLRKSQQKKSPLTELAAGDVGQGARSRGEECIGTCSTKPSIAATQPCASAVEFSSKKSPLDFKFLTFEWYPFDDILLPPEPLLPKQPERLRKAVARLRHGGIPATMPLMISEYGYSVFAGEPEVTMAAALLNADIAATFLEAGGTTSYLYGYEPNRLDCAFGNSWGNLMLFLQQKNGTICAALPTYYAAQLLAECWGGSQNGPRELYPTKVTIPSKKPFVTAYFLHALHSRSSLLLINKNSTHTYNLAYHFIHQGKEASASWKGPLEVFSYSPAQYKWLAHGLQGHPGRNKKPAHFFLNNATEVSLPPWSITVVREKN